MMVVESMVFENNPPYSLRYAFVIILTKGQYY